MHHFCSGCHCRRVFQQDSARVLTPGASVTICASAKSFKCKCKSPSDDSGERLKAVTLRGGNALRSIRLCYRLERESCAHAPTYFCTIVCKCHFPLRWCKALLHGTFPPPSLLHSSEQHYLKPSVEPHSAVWRDGCAQEFRVHHRLSGHPLSWNFASSRLSAAMLK